MNVPWHAIGSVVGTVAPSLASALGTPLAGVAVGAICKALGLAADTPPEAVSAAVVNAAPDQTLALKQADDDFLRATMDIAARTDAGQVDLNKAELATGSMFLAGWRPALCWICDAAVAWQFLVGPLSFSVIRLWRPEAQMVQLDTPSLLSILTISLGFGAYRTVEKLNGVSTRAITRKPKLAKKQLPAPEPPIFVQHGDDPPTVTPLAPDTTQQTADNLHGLYSRFANSPVPAPPEPLAPIVLRPVPAVRDTAFDGALAFTLTQEGGWSDDPHDLGGATMHGITLATFRNWRNNPAATPDELRAIADAEVADIYHTNYWNVVNGDALPPGIALSVFDAAVNTGPRAAAHQLQSLLGVQQDGVIGPITLAAARAADPATFLPRLAVAQTHYYASLDGFARYGNGWVNRVHARLDAASRAAGLAGG